MASKAKQRSNGTGHRLKDAGFVLVPVLLGVALLAAIALAVSNTCRLEIKIQAASMRATKARLLADGITRLIAFRLAGRGWFTYWRRQRASDGATADCQQDGASIAISVVDVAGLVDLNAAPLALIERLLVPLAPDRASQLAAAIVDFRDGDDAPLPNGAEADAYQAIGLAHGPKNDVFEAVAELDQVVGMQPELYAQLKHFVTVHSRQPGVDPSAAPRAIRTILGLAAVSEAQGLNSAPKRTGVDPGGLPMELRARSQGRSFAVRVGVLNSSSGQFTRDAVVDLSPRAPEGFILREWAASTTRPRAGKNRALASCDDVLAIVR